MASGKVITTVILLCEGGWSKIRLCLVFGESVEYLSPPDFLGFNVSGCACLAAFPTHLHALLAYSGVSRTHRIVPLGVCVVGGDG